MLIETPLKTGDVISMKLSSGEELITKLEEESQESYKISKPLMVIAGQQGLGLAPFMFTVNPESSVKINKDNVICITSTEKEMASQYIQNTTGIKLA